jgi:hypothetical protein
MNIALLFLLAALIPQSPRTAGPVPFVVSVLHEAVGDDAVLRLVLSGPPSTYSAGREGEDIVVRISARPFAGLSLPTPKAPIKSLVLDTQHDFTLRISLSEDRAYEIVREMASLRLVLKGPTAKPVAAIQPQASVTPTPGPTPSPRESFPDRSADPVAVDTADLYRRLFPSSADPVPAPTARTEIGGDQNWYSNFRWLGIQARPWLSVSYVNGKTTLIETNTVSSDSYWLIQPNLGLGFSPRLPFLSGEGPREGQWKINYTPRFRRRGNQNLPRLTSHFFDVGLDQPVASLGSLYVAYHFSTGVLETDEIDAGREYGIGLNRVVDTPLEHFKRQSFAAGTRFNVIADTEIDLNATKTSVRYGDAPQGQTAPSDGRAFFDYDTRTLNASAKRGLGESRFIGLSFGVHDTPPQTERAQVEGRGYSYGASLEGDIAALTTGRVEFGYRTQKNPNAGAGGQSYKDISYQGALLRDLSEDTRIGAGAERRLFLSAYKDNGFYVADIFKGDISTKTILDLSLRGSVGYQINGYRTSPQTNNGTDLILRKDRLKLWSLGLSRTLAEWLFLRLDYSAEHRDSNLDRFDLKTRALTIQLGLGFFGKPGEQGRPTW